MTKKLKYITLLAIFTGMTALAHAGFWCSLWCGIRSFGSEVVCVGSEFVDLVECCADGGPAPITAERYQDGAIVKVQGEWGNFWGSIGDWFDNAGSCWHSFTSDVSNCSIGDYYDDCTQDDCE